MALGCFAEPGAEGLIFPSPAGKPLRDTNFRRGTPGNTLAAEAGTSLRELMDRMGHDSEPAELIYLHGSS